MSAILAPGVAPLLDAGERLLAGDDSALEQLAASLEEARRHLEHSRALFYTLWHALLLPPDMQPEYLAARVQETFSDQELACTRIQEFLQGDEPWKLQQGLHLLRSSVARLAEDFDELRRFGQTQPSYSPFPALNYLIQTGLRVHQKTAPPNALRTWLAAATMLIEQVQANADIFARLHPDQKLAEEAARCLADLQQGIGGLLLFLEQEDDTALLDALQLLAAPSRHLHALLRRMDRAAAEQARFSRVLAVEEFARTLEAYQRQGLPWGLVMLSFSSLTRLRDFYLGQVRCVERFPLFYLLQQPLEEAHQATADLQSAMEGFHTLMQPAAMRGEPTAALHTLRAAFERSRTAVDALTERLQQEAVCMRASPNVEEMRELVGRLLLGTVSEQYFQERLQALWDMVEGLLEEARTLPRELGLKEAVSGAMAGLRLLARWSERRDPQLLIDGIFALSEAVPHVLDWYLSLRR